MTSIGDYAFYGCYNLKSVTVGMKTPPEITENTFAWSLSATLYVPIGCKDAYMYASYCIVIDEYTKEGSYDQMILDSNLSIIMSLSGMGIRVMLASQNKIGSAVCF